MEQTCPCSAMATLVIVAEASIGLWIWSVWSWRLRMDSSFRAVGAKNLLQEFQSYGYPAWVLKTVGAFKCSFASMLVLAIIYPMKLLTLVGASGIAILMSVAVFSHVRVKDPLTKSIPAAAMLILSIYLLLAFSANCVAEVEKSNVQLLFVFHGIGFFMPDHLPQVCFGILVFASCFGMWLRSFMNSDYNLDNYEQLKGKEEVFLKA